MNELRHHFGSVAGVRIHWTELGCASARPPIVLLHGLSNSCRSWSRVAPALAADRLVLMPDLPGHGQSERPNVGYELDWYARVMAQWLEMLGIDNADVVGHSFGGGVAQMLLLECPQRVRRLVLVAAGGLGKNVGWWLRLASLPHIVERFGQPFMALGTRLALRDAGDGLTPEEIAELSRLNSQRGTARAFARSVRDVIDWRGQRRNFFHRVEEVKKLPPVLVLWGDRDILIPMGHGAAFADAVKGTVFKKFEGCGHYVHNERPEPFSRMVLQFLDNPAIPPELVAPTNARPTQRTKQKVARRGAQDRRSENLFARLRAETRSLASGMAAWSVGSRVGGAIR